MGTRHNRRVRAVVKYRRPGSFLMLQLEYHEDGQFFNVYTLALVNWEGVWRTHHDPHRDGLSAGAVRTSNYNALGA